MNIYELSVKAQIPLVRLRKLQKFGVLNVDPENELVDAIIFHMRGNRYLSSTQLMALAESPDLMDELHTVRPRYARRARAQIAALGDVSPAPLEVTAAIPWAAAFDDDQTLIIVGWLKAVLPSEPVPHAWVAVRLLKPLNAFLREQFGPLISPALSNARKLPEFSGWWRREMLGSRPGIIYQNPGERFDL